MNQIGWVISMLLAGALFCSLTPLECASATENPQLTTFLLTSPLAISVRPLELNMQTTLRPDLVEGHILLRKRF